MSKRYTQTDEDFTESYWDWRARSIRNGELTAFARFEASELEEGRMPDILNYLRQRGGWTVGDDQDA